MATSLRAVTNKKVENSPGVLVLQWLTYAFWGWTILALTFLTAMSIRFFLNDVARDNYESDTIAYSLAAVIVLFVISLICDVLYSRHEPLRKHSAAMVIMIIHAVIFALCGIGALIVAVFAVVNLLIGSNDASTGVLTTLITGVIIAVVYGATLLRTLRPLKLKRSSQLYWLFMAVVTIAMIVLAIAGPTLYARQTKDDRLIERGLPDISSSIRDHAAKNDALPGKLTDLKGTQSDDEKELIDRNLVEYTPGKKIETSAVKDGRQTMIYPTPGQDAFEYTLCVTYKGEKSPNVYDRPYRSARDTSPNTYSHDKGRVCYDLATEYVY